MAKHSKPTTIKALIREDQPCLAICVGKKCAKAGAKHILAAAGAGLEAEALGEIPLRLTKCQDFCDDAPMLSVLPGEFPYLKLTPAGVRQIVSAHLGRGEPVRDLLHKRARRRLEKQERRLAEAAQED
ncbi:MAG TPA: (2Fe-2S) ferredoxin domain-containing protein [Herpetosiphonaceae bacterium]|nr:(2Fe-2S) ferredoxin domain-containing protein [Herpetosiphonaceae bacterium]